MKDTKYATLLSTTNNSRAWQLHIPVMLTLYYGICIDKIGSTGVGTVYVFKGLSKGSKKE